MAQGETKLLYPGLAGFYETMLPIAATFVRIVIGIMFLMHVSVKFKMGADAVAANVFSKNGSSLLYCGYTLYSSSRRSAAFA